MEVRRQGGVKELRVGVVGTSVLSEAKRGLGERAGWEGKGHLQTQRKPGPSQQPPLQPLASTLVPSSLFSTENLGLTLIIFFFGKKKNLFNTIQQLYLVPLNHQRD